MSSIPGQRREAAELRRAGKITAAGKLLLSAGLPLEAATVFAEAHRYEEALAALLLASPSRSIDELEPDLLLRAAEWLETLRRWPEAAKAYRLVGDEARARALDAQSAKASPSPLGQSVAAPARPPQTSQAPPRLSSAAVRPHRIDMRSEPDIEPERISSLPVDRVSSVPPENGRTSALPVEPRRASSAPPRGPSSKPPPAAGPVSQRFERRADAAARSLEAAVAAERSGDLMRAADLYLAAGAPIGAVRCFMARSELPRALAAIVKVPPNDPQYRKAVTLGVDLSTRLGSLDFAFHQFSAPFFEGEPRDEDEVNAFYRMGILFEQFDHVDDAKAVLRRVLKVRNAAAIRDRLAALEARAEKAKASFAKAMEEDDAFRRSSPPPAPKPEEETFPSLPEIQLPIRSRRPPNNAESPRAGSPAPFDAPDRTSTPADAPQRAGAPKKVDRPTETDNRPPKDAPIVNVFNIGAGITIARRYKIEQLLGKGGMGAVYRAHDLELDEALAIKLFAHGRDDATLVSRFKQELSLARQISHANVIRLYDFGQQGAIPFITMELLAGRDLAEEMEQGRELMRDLGFLIQACRGLQCVHERGVVHRDLKPENLFVTTDGVVKLMDFGIAKRSSTPANLTQQGFTAGTPAYMAPEQAESFATASHLSDIYSVGVIAYRMFTGVLPFDNENPMAVLIKHIQEIPVPPRDHDPSIPDELEYIILQLLEKKPELRVQSCAELANDLERLRTRLEARPSRRPR